MKPMVFVCQYLSSQNLYVVSRVDGAVVHVCENLTEIENFIKKQMGI